MGPTGAVCSNQLCHPIRPIALLQKDDNFMVHRETEFCPKLNCGRNFIKKNRSQISSVSNQRNDLNDLCANGEGAWPDGTTGAGPVSRIRPPLMLGVFAQKAQMYTGGMSRLVMLIHLPCSHSSQASLQGSVSRRSIQDTTRIAIYKLTQPGLLTYHCTMKASIVPPGSLRWQTHRIL